MPERFCFYVLQIIHSLKCRAFPVKKFFYGQLCQNRLVADSAYGIELVHESGVIGFIVIVFLGNITIQKYAIGNNILNSIQKIVNVSVFMRKAVFYTIFKPFAANLNAPMSIFIYGYSSFDFLSLDIITDTLEIRLNSFDCYDLALAFIVVTPLAVFSSVKRRFFADFSRKPFAPNRSQRKLVLREIKNAFSRLYCMKQLNIIFGKASMCFIP